MAEENRDWGYRRIQGALSNLGHELARGMSQIGRNLTDGIDGILKGKRYLIHDRDPLFTIDFLKC